MLITDTQTVSLPTPAGAMQTHLFTPSAPGRYPGIILYSEIFQVTGPIRRMAALIAGHGYLVAVPEIYHELEPVGSVLTYTPEGSARGNSHKIAKELSAYDHDTRACIAYLAAAAECTGTIAAMGVCLGGHLAFRAALQPEIAAAACLYPTDLHKRGLGKGQHDDSLQRCGEVRGELLMIFGRQDPHIPAEGRRMIYQALSEAERTFEWHEFNAAHAFMRDEGNRYNPQVATIAYQLVLDLFARRLHHSGAGAP